MKQITTFISFTIIYLSFTSSCISQLSTIVENFTAFENNGKIDLNWFISSGNTCSGIKIYRSADSTNFELIGTIEGVCGSISTRSPYNFSDESPLKNSYNRYKLELGGSGFSEIVSVEIIDKGQTGYQIRPNPVSTNTKLYFDNLIKSEHQLEIYNLQGIKILTLSTQEDYFLINSLGFQSGIYHFVLLSTAQPSKINGTFFVQH